MATQHEIKSTGADFEAGIWQAAAAVREMLEAYAVGSPEREALWCAWDKLASPTWRETVRLGYVEKIHPEPSPAPSIAA
jgi:hypothetical protein